MLKITAVLYCVLFVKGILTKSIQNDTLDNRIAALEKLVDKLEARINKTDNSIEHPEETNDHKKAVFYARLTSTITLNTYSTIKFDSVIINEGGHYNPTDGIFVAPVSGVYLLAWSTLTYSGNTLFTELLVEGVVKGVVASTAASSMYTPASMSLVCQVKQGNHVWVQTSSTSSNYLYDWKDSISFMGLLLYKD